MKGVRPERERGLSALARWIVFLSATAAVYRPRMIGA